MKKDWLPLNQIVQGNALAILRKIRSNSVDVCVSSPPYWGLRDYGTAMWLGGDPECDHKGEPMRTRAYVNENAGTGKDVKNKENHQPFKGFCGKCGAQRVDDQIGLEATPELFIKKLVKIYREIRRILKPTGVCYINIGDSYWGGKGKSGHGGKEFQQLRSENGASFSSPAAHVGGKNKMRPQDGKHPHIKTKDLVGVPWMLAFALRKDGWYLRQDVIWNKKNPMPESMTDRCTKSHEYIFHLTKSQDYFFDAEAIKEPASEDSHLRGSRLDRAKVGHKSNPTDERNGMRPRKLADAGSGTKTNTSFDAAMRLQPMTRNKRSVWTIGTQAYPDAHFATFPDELPEICIKAGSSEKGCCAACGSPWERIVEKSGGTTGAGSWTTHENNLKMGMSNDNCNHEVKKLMRDGTYTVRTIGWEPTCECNGYFYQSWFCNLDDREEDSVVIYFPEIPLENHPMIPSVVLDQFSGAGTTCMVAKKLNRDYIGIELNKEYIGMSDKRFAKEFGLFND